MNPYVYRRKAVSLSVLPGKARNVLPGLLKSVMTSAISTSAAFAIVAFASVGVAAVAMVAHSEIAGTAYEPAIKSAYTAQTHQPSVLGAVSYGYNQPKCTKAGACLNYQWINFNNDGWQAKIDYQLPAKYQSGYIRVNGWKFMDGISGSGSGYTGYDLEPGQRYTFTLYGRYGRLNYKLTSLSLVAPDAPEQTCPAKNVMLPSNCSYDYSADPCGQVVCHAIDPVPPVYGYQAVSVAQPDRGWREGWVEQVYYGSDRAPGSMKILGWVYDNGGSLSWNGLQLAMKNETTGASYNPVDISIEKSSRSDIQNYINQKLGITAGNAISIYVFVAKFDNLPAGTYSVYNARYNGYLFNNAHHGPYYISQAQQPSYGYQNVSVFTDSTTGWKEGWLENLQGTTQAPGKLTISGWAYDGNRSVQVQLVLRNIQTPQDYRPVSVQYSPYADNVKTYLQSVRGGHADAAGSFTATFTDLPAGTYLLADAKYNNQNNFNVHSQFISNYGQGWRINSQPTYGYTAPMVKVVSPNGGEAWVKGQGVSIQYSAAGVSFLNAYLKPYVACFYTTPKCLMPEVKPYFMVSNIPAGSVGAVNATSFVLNKDLEGRDVPEGAYLLSLVSADGSVSDTSDQPFKVSVPVPAQPNNTFRYLKIESTSSNSWVAWREIEVYDTSGVKQSPTAFTASSAYLNSTGDRAYDGDPNTVWNAGAYTGNIVLDYGKTLALGKVRLLPANYPNPATNAYNIQTSKDGTTWTVVRYVSGTQLDNTWYEQVGPWAQ